VEIIVLGACGGWPEAGSACSGFLVEHQGFRVLVDAGYATFPRLLEVVAAEAVDAVLISHGHPDHCADLNPLLRARMMGPASDPGADPLAALPVYAPTGALDAVLALDRPGMLDDALDLREFSPGATLDVGPFTVATRLLPHFVPNAGMRLTVGGAVLAYTGDTGPAPAVVELAAGADVLIAEATHPELMSAADAPFLSTAVQAATQATQADVGRLVLTHLWPGTDPDAALDAARGAYAGPIDVARSGLRIAV
jgi:ribonuclease BN (tRNA processing enzyme)